jgi:hypothetical protein
MLFNFQTVILLAFAFMATANPASPVGEVNARQEVSLEPRSKGKSKSGKKLTEFQVLLVDVRVTQIAATAAQDRFNLFFDENAETTAVADAVDDAVAKALADATD